MSGPRPAITVEAVAPIGSSRLVLALVAGVIVAVLVSQPRVAVSATTTQRTATVSRTATATQTATVTQPAKTVTVTTTTTKTVTQGAPTASVTAVQVNPTATTADQSGDGGLQWWAWVLIGLGVAGLGVAVYALGRRRSNAPGAPPP